MTGRHSNQLNYRSIVVGGANIGGKGGDKKLYFGETVGHDGIGRCMAMYGGGKALSGGMAWR